MAFAGTIVLATGLAIDATLAFAMAETAGDVDPVATQSLSALWSNDFFPFVLGIALLHLAAGLVVVRTRALPVALGWIANALAVVALTLIGFVGFGGGAVWVVVVSVLLTLRRRRVAPAVA